MSALLQISLFILLAAFSADANVAVVIIAVAMHRIAVKRFNGVTSYRGE